MNICHAQPGAIAARLSVNRRQINNIYAIFLNILKPAKQFNNNLPLFIKLLCFRGLPPKMPLTDTCSVFISFATLLKH